MDGVGIFMTIILGGLAGIIAEKIMKADMGIFMNVIVGIVGAMVLNFTLDQLGIYTGSGSWIIQCIVAIVGACILIAIYRAIAGRSR